VMLIVVIHLLLVGDRPLTAGFKAATVSTAHAVRLFHTHLRTHHLMATRRRIGMATSTTPRFLAATSRYSIAPSTRDHRVFGR
jgi:hypothetical protein